MELKRNEATINRPEGDRVLDASYVFVDLPEFLSQLKEEKAWKKNDRNGITVYKSDVLTIVLTVMHEGAIAPENVTDELLTLQVIEGTIKVTTVNGDVELKQHQLISFHSKVPHSITATTEAAFMIWSYRDQ